MANTVFDFRHLRVQKRTHFSQIINARHNIETLAATVTLSQQCLTHDHRIEGCDKGSDGQTVYRRCCDNRQFPHTRKRQLQRAWNGRCRECKHVHIRANFFQALFMAHTKVLLLIHNQQAKVFEADGFA